MKQYLVRLTELAGAGFLAGAGSYLAENGLDYSSAGLKGLLVAGLMAAYGIVIKQVGDKDRPTASK